MDVPLLKNIFVVLFGSCVGSFLNVCIYRLPQDKSIVRPRSFCPGCKTPIKWYDNIPILSFVMLRGRCRQCRSKIALRYPVVEILTALIFLVLYLYFGLSWEFAKFILFFCLLILVSFIDIDYHAIPAYLCVIGICAGLGFSIPPSLRAFEAGIVEVYAIPIVVALRNLIFGFGFAYLFKFFGDVFIELYLNFRKKESIEGERESLGLGDVDFLGMVSVFLGIKAAILVFFLAPFFAIIYSVIALMFKRSHLIPYLPYLSLAAAAVFFWGDKILRFIF